MPGDPRYSLSYLAKRLNMGPRWIVTNLAPEHHYGPDYLYSHDCLLDLEAKRDRFMSLPRLGKAYTLPRAAKSLKCSRFYVVEMIKEFELPGVQQYRTTTHRVVNGIPAETIRDLRQLMPKLAPSGWLSVNELRRETGWASDTIRLRLRRARLESKLFRSASNGHILAHYEAEGAFEVLGRKPRYMPPGGENLTAHAMGELLGRTVYWMSPRLAEPRFAACAKPMLDDSCVIRDHYPRVVLRELKRRSDAQRLRQQTKVR